MYNFNKIFYYCNINFFPFCARQQKVSFKSMKASPLDLKYIDFHLPLNQSNQLNIHHVQIKSIKISHLLDISKAFPMTQIILFKLFVVAQHWIKVFCWLNFSIYQSFVHCIHALFCVVIIALKAALEDPLWGLLGWN